MVFTEALTEYLINDAQNAAVAARTSGRSYIGKPAVRIVTPSRGRNFRGRNLWAG